MGRRICSNSALTHPDVHGKDTRNAPSKTSIPHSTFRLSIHLETFGHPSFSPESLPVVGEAFERAFVRRYFEIDLLEVVKGKATLGAVKGVVGRP